MMHQSVAYTGGAIKRFICCFSYVGETSCARARQRRRHQQPSDVSSCHGDGYVRCVMSLVQAGADVSGVWRMFVKIFPASTSQPITFQQMVVCEVLTQVQAYVHVETFVHRMTAGIVKLVVLLYPHFP